MQEVIIDVEAAVKNIRFVNIDGKARFLTKGNNNFTVSFDIKNKNLKFPVLLTNVQDANELDKTEIEIYINGILNDKNLLKVGYENEDINTDNITKWKKKKNGQKIHKKVKNAIINIATTETSKPKELNVTIEVTNLPYGIGKITKQILYMTNKIEPITIPTPSSNTFDEVINLFNNKVTTTNLTTYNKKKDALNAIEEEIVNYFLKHKLPTPEFEYDFSEINKNLTVGQNVIKFGVKNPETNKITDLNFILTGVTEEDDYRTSEQNMVIEKFSRGHINSKFNDRTSYESALSYLNIYTRNKFSSYLNIELKDKTQMNTLLKVGDNRIDVVVTTIEGKQPVYFTVLIKNVQPFVALQEVKKRYEKRINFAQGTPAFTYADIISNYQDEINQNFPSEKITISLKDPRKLAEKLPKGRTEIDVNYIQNLEILSGVIIPFLWGKGGN